MANDGDSLIHESEVSIVAGADSVYGTLTASVDARAKYIALIIGGSGPTDRNGNSPFTTTNNLRNLAWDLARRGIASVRFDKRGIGKSKAAAGAEETLKFTDYVEDARSWLALLHTWKYTTIAVIGHSEGALIGLLAADRCDKYVSIAGTARPADQVLKEQLAKQPDVVKTECYRIIDTLKSGHKVAQIKRELFALFRPSVQPYLISWFAYDPVKEIAKLRVPILVIHGTKDLQVPATDADALAAGNKGAKKVIVENMNHVLFEIKGGTDENVASYKDSNRQVSPVLIAAIAQFLKEAQ